MKTRILVMFITLIFINACNLNSQKDNLKEELSSINYASNQKLQIYYFHLTNRCPTCNSIEANVKKVVETEFKNEFEEGIINFVSLNIDDPKNSSLSEKYQVYGASLHFIELNNGVELDKNLTEFAFANSKNNPDIFLKAIKDTINNIINN